MTKRKMNYLWERKCRQVKFEAELVEVAWHEDLEKNEPRLPNFGDALARSSLPWIGDPKVVVEPVQETGEDVPMEG